MRRLLYVPIIHEAADMGSSGNAVAQQSSAITGEERWCRHQELVSMFWRRVGSYLNSFPPKILKVYQDGLPADGDVGRNIVEEAARRGSSNYRAVLELLNKGAQLRKTEDPVLLLQEYQNLLALVGQGEAGGVRPGLDEYRIQRDRLTRARDRFIASTIAATLEAGDLGVLFIGADHRVAELLPSDISVEMLKDPKTVHAYLDCLFQGQDDERLEQLGKHLSGPVLAGREDGSGTSSYCHPE